MTQWQVRPAGANPIPVDGPRRVLEGLRDGDWEPADDVRGPADRDWRPIEEHPQFADAVAEMGPPPAEHPDDTKLDMNPLIDVALVLLIFFILTTTYSSLRRAIDLPPVPEDKEGAKAPIKKEDIQERSFTVKVRMDGQKPVVTLETKVVQLADLDREVQEFVKATGRKELLADVTGDVPWGVEAKLYDAAKGAGIHQIYWPRKR